MYSRTNASSRPTVDTKYPRAQKLCPTKFCFRPPYTRARGIALFPLINPITCATAYFGGIEIIMCTWSGSRCPSSIRLSFCSASLRNTSPKYFLRSPYNAFRRPFGINTTWYLHSHFEWLKLSYSSIQFLLCVCFAAHARSFLDGLPYLSNFACLPGRAGGTPISLGRGARSGRVWDGFTCRKNWRRTFGFGKQECPDSSPDAFIFPDAKGGFMDTGNYRKRVLHKLARDLGLPKLTFQVIRRTIATAGAKEGHGQARSRTFRDCSGIRAPQQPRMCTCRRPGERSGNDQCDSCRAQKKAGINASRLTF